MAGAQNVIDITVDDAEIRAGLRDLEDKIGNLQPFFRDIGEALLNSTRERFNTMRAPDGSLWPSLSPGYAGRKSKNAELILTLNGYLRGLLTIQTSKDTLRIGTPLIYGATHQVGDASRHIPARPFLGLSESDTQDILDALEEWLARDLPA